MILKPLLSFVAAGCALAAGAAHADPPHGRGVHGVPPGHLPPPGACRVWHDGVPPGRQPPPTDCHSARYDAYRYGGRVIYGADYHDDPWAPVWYEYECDDRDYYKGEC